MNIVCDEGVERAIVAALRLLGHTVVWIAESHPAADDEVVLDAAEQADAVLVTEDKDFGELTVRRGRVSHGVMLIRMHGLADKAKAAAAVAALAAVGPWRDVAMAVVTQKGVRVRYAHKAP